MSSVGRGIVLRQLERLLGEGTLTGLGDGPLLERYLTHRDEDAFEALVDRLGPMVLGLCRRMLRDPEDIDDAFQATFLVLARKAPAIRDRDRLSSWLYGVAYRVARRARSRTLRRRERESTVGVPEVAAEPEPERSEIDPMLDQELSRLPERYREPLVLCYLRGRTHEQAAADLSCPVGTVRSRLARGRDLLRDRLTRRGFAPTALGAILGRDVSLPARLLVAEFPPSMAAATVRAAVGFGAPSILKAGAAAATSVALARGVLTTMKLAQLKWIGLAAMTTCLSAGTVVAVGSAAAQRPESQTAGQHVEARPSGEAPEKKKAETPTEKYVRETEQKIDQLLKDIGFYPSDGSDGGPAGDGSLATRVLQDKLGPKLNWRGTADVATQARLKSLEQKIDTLLGRSGTPPSFDTRFAPAQDGDATPPQESRTNRRPQGRPAQDPASTTPSIRELEARLKLATQEFAQTEKLSNNHVVSMNELELVRGRARIIAAQVESLDEETQDELDRLRLERRRKAAQLDKARAEADMAAALVNRNQVLNRRKPGMVADEEVARFEGQLKAAVAQKDIAEVEVAEVDLRMQQLSRRRDRIKELNELARPVK